MRSTIAFYCDNKSAGNYIPSKRTGQMSFEELHQKEDLVALKEMELARKWQNATIQADKLLRKSEQRRNDPAENMRRDLKKLRIRLKKVRSRKSRLRQLIRVATGTGKYPDEYENKIPLNKRLVDFRGGVYKETLVTNPCFVCSHASHICRHIIPLERGGNNRSLNLMVLCGNCDSQFMTVVHNNLTDRNALIAEKHMSVKVQQTSG